MASTPTVGLTHDVRIGTNYFLIRPGSYSKRAAPMFGARFSSGDPDFNNLSFWQHWAQTCWVGGFGAETWSDDAMFDEGVGIDATQHEVMTLSRDLGPQASRGTGNWDLNLGEVLPREFKVFNSKLYCLQTNHATTSRLYVFTSGTSTWTLIKTFAKAVCSWEMFAGYLVFGSSGTGAVLDRMDTAEAFTTFAKPAGLGFTWEVHTMKEYRAKLYVAYGREIWRLNPDFTWDGSTVFYNAVGVEYIIRSEVHLGFLYFASIDGHVLRTDGNNTFDIWQFDGGLIVNAMRSYDGRLFVAVSEPLVGTNSAQVVLYQFTGAALTELKRWGKVGTYGYAGFMRVVGSRLYFGASQMLGMGGAVGFGIAAYDALEDGYHLWSTCQDATLFPGGTEGINWIVDDVIYFAGYMWCSVRGYGVFRTLYSYHDVSRYQATYDTTAAGAIPAAGNGGWYESSDFDAGTPGLLKLWNAITVHCDLPTAATSYTLEYSLDGGENYVLVGTLVGNPSDTRTSKVWNLGALKDTRLKYRVTLRTTDSTRSPQLRGVVVRYLPVPEPNWVWDFVVVLSDHQELLDGTLELIPDVDAKRLALETAFRAGTLVEFQDVDGTVWATAGTPGVLIQDISEQARVLTSTTLGDHEFEVRLVLHEGVEAY